MGTFNCPLCGKNTPHHHSGVWTLTAPDGRQWHGDSPIKACREEQRSRIPDEVAVKRVMQEPEWDDNPDGIKPGEERGHRMNRDTGFWE